MGEYRSVVAVKMCVTSFGTCDLKEDDWGDMLLLDRILLCFLKGAERTDRGWTMCNSSAKREM